MQSCLASSWYSYHRGTIDLASVLGFNEDENEGDDKWGSIGHQVVFPLQGFELLGVVLLEQGQVNIDCHGQVPEGVGRNEPAVCQLLALHNSSDFTLHLNEEALELAQV